MRSPQRITLKAPGKQRCYSAPLSQLILFRCFIATRAERKIGATGEEKKNEEERKMRKKNGKIYIDYTITE
jgi:hypothetical protein